MTSVLQAVDTDDETILFDFQDPTGANNPFGVQTWFGVDGAFSIAPPQREVISYEPDIMDGSRILRTRNRARLVSWQQRILAADYDSLVAGVGELSQILRRGGILRWQPDGASEARWLDFMPSDAPVLFGGQQVALQYMLSEFDTVYGVPMVLATQPYLRGPLLTSGTNYLVNSTLLRQGATTDRPRSWTWDSTTGLSDEDLSATGDAYQFILATTGVRNLEQTTAAASAAPGDTWSLSVYARCIAGTDAWARVVGRYYDNAASPVAAEETGTLVQLTSVWQRLTLTMSTAPASTDRVKVSIRFENTDVAPQTIELHFAQAERGTVSSFVTSAATMSNNPVDVAGSLALPVYIHGNAWAPVALTIRSSDADAQIQEYLVARRSDGGETEVKQVVGYLNGSATTLENQTLSNDTSSVADADAANGNAAEVDYGSEPDPTVFKKRVRAGFFISPYSMRGTWDVWLRARATDTAVHEIQLRWGASFSSPAPNVNTVVILDSSQATTFPYVWLYLGAIAVPYDFDTLQGVALEVWTRVDGDGDLRLDFLAYAPVDDPEPSLTRIIAPPRSTESWLGEDLTTPPFQHTGDPTLTAGAVVGDNMRLNAATQGMGTPPNTGSEWEPGLQRVTFHHQTTSNVVLRPVYQIVNVTDDAIVVKYDPGVELIGDLFGDFVLEAPTVAGKLYQAQVYLAARTQGSLRIDSITHESVPYLGQQAGVYTDAETGMVAKVDSSDNFQTRLESRGPIPVWCPPGLSVLYVHAVDIPALGYSIGQSQLDRTWTLSVTYAPRFWV